MFQIKIFVFVPTLFITESFSYNSFMRKFLKSFGYALGGIYATLKSERNFRIHTVLMLLAIGMGIYLGLSVVNWCLVTFAIGFVLSAELFNTALERLGDETAQGKQSLLIKNVKDMAAGAVLISAVTALVIGILILFIPFIHRMMEL